MNESGKFVRGSERKRNTNKNSGVSRIRRLNKRVNLKKRHRSNMTRNMSCTVTTVTVSKG